MSILTWIEDKKRLKVLNAPKHVVTAADSSKGLWTRCDKCGVILYIKHLKENQRVCFGCNYHLQMMSQERIENLLDKVAANSSNKSSLARTYKAPHTNPDDKVIRPFGQRFVRNTKKICTTRSLSRESMVSTWRPLDETVSPCDPLRFHDQKNYTDRLQDAQERTGLQDAIQTGTGMIDGIPVALAVMDFSFMGGSMGSVVGEKITRLIEYATQEGLTLLIVSASGGARMQEGVFSLMQMAKISSALQIYQSCAKLLYISILTSPTTGGVTASFAMLGDIIFAEPKALIAFAGRRVIEQTLCEDLPDDFQTSEYMLHHGLVDLIVPRRFLRQALSETIRLYQNAPFKKRGQIPFGVQNPITFLTEEKIRRQWGLLTKTGTKLFKKELSTFIQSGATPLGTYERTTQNQKFVNDKSSTEIGENRLLEITESTFVPKPNVYHFSEDSFVSPLKNKDHLQTGVYREILTSFESMLNLFVAGNSKKQNMADCNTSYRRKALHQRRYKSLHLQISNLYAIQIKDLYGDHKHLHARTRNLYPCAYAQPKGLRVHTYKSPICLPYKAPHTNQRFVHKAYKSPICKRSFATRMGGVSEKICAYASASACKKVNGFARSIPNFVANLIFVEQKMESKNNLSKKSVGVARTNPPKGEVSNVYVQISDLIASRNAKLCKTYKSKSTPFLTNTETDTNRRFVSKYGSCTYVHGLRTRTNRSFVRKFDRHTLEDRNNRSAVGMKYTDYLHGRAPSFCESFTSQLLSCKTYKASLYKPSKKRVGSKKKEENIKIYNFENGLSKKREPVSLFPSSSLKIQNTKIKKLSESSRRLTNFAAQETDINFLNQAIELAATESVEWRAFYIYEQLSGNTNFWEDFLKQESNSKKKSGNFLFYRSICRN